MRFLTVFKTVFFSCCAIVAISFAVPGEKPETVDYESERFLSARLSASGDTLLLRSQRHDYEFSLPPNALNAAFALNLGDPMRCDFDQIFFDEQTREATIDFEVFFGRYTAPLVERARVALGRLGFTQTNYGAYYPAWERYMHWVEGNGLRGKRHPAGSRPERSGTDLSRCIEHHGIYIVIVRLEPETVQRNRLINRLTSPFRAIRKEITDGFFKFLRKFGRQLGV